MPCGLGIAEIMSEALHGVEVPLPPAIVEAIEDFTITKRLEEGRSENTVRAYAHDLRMFFRFVVQLTTSMGSPISAIVDVKVAHVKRFLLSLDERSYTKVGIARKIATLKSFFSYARFIGLVQERGNGQGTRVCEGETVGAGIHHAAIHVRDHVPGIRAVRREGEGHRCTARVRALAWQGKQGTMGAAR